MINLERSFTLDLFQDEKDKTLEYQTWVRRISIVSSTMSISYDSILQMTEVEFRIIEGMAKEMLEKRKERSEKMRSKK